jgi:hypothetical protein
MSLMYVPHVYEVRSINWPDNYQVLSTTTFLSRIGTFYYDANVRIVGIVVYENEGFTLDETSEVEQEIKCWHRRTMACLAGFGAVIGVVVGWREQRRANRRPLAPRGGWLWLAVAAAVFGILFVAGVPGEYWPSAWTWVRWNWEAIHANWAWFWNDLGEPLAWETLRLGLPALIIGWAGHVAAGARGIRFPRGRRPEQAADYAESVPTPAK